MDADLSDTRYLYRYGEYISDCELEIARFLNSMEEEKIQSMADTYTEGYRLGFVNLGVDLSKKRKPCRSIIRSDLNAWYGRQ